MLPGKYRVLQDTKLGWIISGKIPLTAPEGVPRKSIFIRNNDNLDQHLQRFWVFEECQNIVMDRFHDCAFMVSKFRYYVENIR
jgi:hypothetical protein